MCHKDRTDLRVDTDELANQRSNAPLRKRQLLLGAVDLRPRIALPPGVRAVLSPDPWVVG